MASAPYRLPNILKDTTFFTNRSSSNDDSCHQVHVRIYWVSYTVAFKAPEKINQEEINQVIWGPCDEIITLNSSACKQLVSCIGTVKDSGSHETQDMAFVDLLRASLEIFPDTILKQRVNFQ
ncbi:hypothetical protein AVEN_162213-1 [Araneus ventricosus]|uniref:Uncharacterized protein n=1 Tax=Araneus ventricosus TaxID=182803 RepID=A0A4Y2EYX2_ARAVE|nr:hypothetical protein AVEN_162213-1 [Araneus ventricosus]